MIASMNPAAVLVLAAGKSTRMKSRTPKFMHEIGGLSLLGHVVRSARALEPTYLAVVVGHGRDQVVPHLAQLDEGAQPVVQEEQRGTGHAVRTALEALPALDGTVVVTYADVPLLPVETLRQLLEGHRQAGAAATVLSAVVPDPSGYGRILRDEKGVSGIVEHKDATPEQAAIAEINSGIYAFDARLLTDALGRVKADNSQGEEYLTDVLGILREDGHTVSAVVAGDYQDILGVNDQLQLAELRRILNDRILAHWMRSGVTVVDPATTWVDTTVTLEPDATIHPNTQLRGTTTVAAGTQIGPDTTLIDTRIGADAQVIRTHGEGAQVGAGATVGPFAYLRPGTRLDAGGKIGTFVETKNAEIGPGAKVPHLTYVGDATIGEGTNIGAGTIFANYDGVAKHHTHVGSHSFVGSDSVLVAPRQIADGAYVAAGSTVVKDVEPGELAVARGQQRNIAGWVARKRAGTRTAEAAARAVDASGGTPAEPGGPPDGPPRDTGSVEDVPGRSGQ
ncbi:bifunctional UDP-N-acetylglucosamine diphosphorylase/glucosamine-1-phosphate N-acetyltransferase GlmU [Actinopolymorpha alba]|uniref:bifunctional UDP-N-acetylglucosamine diphosphorylase/glucosamine-1-phosphate N-acetyltransferase GlmU n=1 Tax=Actinopolymorpha alba TaxID=533267 RepID=UPI00039B5E03